MSVSQAEINQIVTRLRNQGMRLTPQRMAVLTTLIGNTEHLSAEEIYARIRVQHPMIGLATIYKTVAMLKNMGVIAELNINNASARYDGSGLPPHPHFVCNQCNTIIDMEETILENLSTQIAKENGYQITNYRLDFFGICPNCQSES